MKCWLPAVAILLAVPAALPLPARLVVAGAGEEEQRRVSTEATRAVALPFLRTMFVDRDVRRAYDRFAAPDFLQHNPHMANGLAGHRAYFAELERRAGRSSAQWANVNDMILIDGDLFALLHRAFTAPEDKGRAFVDIWRVADGRIVEHWDVIQPMPARMAHDNGMGCGKAEDHASAMVLARRNSVDAPLCGLPDPKQPRAASLQVVEAYSALLRAGKVDQAVDHFLTGDYRQHAPSIPDGKRGALAFLREQFAGGSGAGPQMGPLRIIAEGDFVLMHRLTRYADGRHTANVDIFQVRGKQISAHWDVRQDVPPTAANDNGMW